MSQRVKLLNWRAMRALMRKDLKTVFQNKMIWMPMIFVPLLLQVILPLVMVLLPTLAGDAMMNDMDDLGPFLEQMPESIRSALQGLNAIQQWVVISANYMFAPLFLVIPMMVASILGADSFAGEKERKTLEGLLYTPLSDTELYVAKLLTSVVPAVAISVGSFVLYGVVVNTAGYRIMGRLFYPAPMWWPMVFWVGPGVSVVGLGATVLISSKAKGFLQTQQMSGMLVLPIVALMIAQINGLLFLSPLLLIAIGLFIWLVGICLVWIGAKTFQRGELIARL